MRLTAFALCLIVVCAAAQGREYWVNPMRQVHADYTGTIHPIARFGDSITYSGSFFEPLGAVHSNTTPEDDEASFWIRTLAMGTAWTWQDDTEAYDHGCWSGKTSSWALQYELDPARRNIDYWLQTHNPEMAVIMWGTNDLHTGISVAGFTDNMRQVVQASKANGTIPLLTTIPPRRFYVSKAAQFAQAIRDLAVEQQVPLIDYHAEILARRPSDWDGTLISADGVHPSNTAPTRDFSETMLNTNGYTLRNWLTLHQLYDVYKQVIVATPVEISYLPVGLGGGAYGFSLSLEATDAVWGDYVAELTFEPTSGAIRQVKAFSLLDVNDEGTAVAMHNAAGSGYDMAEDTYVLNPFGQNVVQASEDGGNYYFSASTGGVSYGDVDLAYVVATGGLHYFGQITRGGVAYQMDGIIPLPSGGDANLDGVVNVQDLSVLATNWGLDPANWLEGNFNADTVVNVQDLSILATGWSGGAGQGVPEPATLLLIALGAAPVLLRGRR